MSTQGRTLVCAGAVGLVIGAGLAVQLGARTLPRVTVTGTAAIRERDSPNPVTTINADVLEKLPTGRTFDQVIMTLPDTKPVSPGYVPEGWQAEQKGRDVRVWGPPLDRVRFRLDMNGDYSKDYIGKQATFQSSFKGTRDEPFKVTIESWPKVDPTPNLEGILTVPPQAAPGMPLLIGVASPYRDGQWQLTSNNGGVPLIPVERLRDVQVMKSVPQSLYSFRDSGGLTAVLKYPEPRPFISLYPTMGSFTRARYTDPWGETVVDAPLSITPASPTSGSRALTSASSLAFAGQSACVSGRFPKFDDAYGLLLDGKTELQPWGVSPTTVMVGIPDKTAAGPHTISDGVSKIGLTVLTVEGSLDQNKLWRGESTTMRLRVLGTDRQFPLAVLNRTPGVISIDGGVRQVVTTPGGADNAVTRSVTGIHRGDFTIVYSVNTAGCGG